VFQLIAILLFVGSISAAGIAGWNHFTGSYITQGATAQKELDQKVVDLAEARAVRAETDALKVASASKVQSEAIAAESQRTAVAQQEMKRIGDAYASVVRSSEARIAALKSAASAVPLAGQTCSEVLSKADEILRGSARVMNGR